MRLTVVGSSDAFNASGRSNACYWLEHAGDRPFMVDFGPTALRALHERGRSPLDLAGIVFTHLHGDHTAGYPFLHIAYMYELFRRDPFEVVGPPGTRQRLEDLLRVTYGKLGEKETAFPIRWRELAPGEETELFGARIQAFAADHMDPPEVPLCLRVQGRTGETVAFSGDTQLCEGLFAAADGADLLVAECSGLAPPHGRHITWAEWQEAWPRVKARRVLLTHLGRQVRARTSRLLAEAPPGLDLGFADDGLVVDLG